MKRYSKTQIIFIALTFLVVLLSALYQYRNELFGGSSPPAIAEKEEQVSKTDIDRVEDLTEEFLTHFKEGNENTEAELNEITGQYLSKEFNEKVLPDPNESYSWYGMYGLGSFFNKEKEKVEGTLMDYRIKTTIGYIKSFEISDVQTDQLNNTITTYIRMDAVQPNMKHWIEWRDIPGEGWKVNAVTFSANIKALDTPISPKKEW